MDGRTRYALLVANEEYEDPELPQLLTPVKDADALARVLRDPKIGDFEVELVVNEPEHELRRRVNRFLGARRPGDTALLHFSCHGVKDESGQFFLAARNTERLHLDDSALDGGWLNRRMESCRAKRKVLLLDCCYSGSFTRDMTAKAGGAVNALDAFEGTGTVILTASGPLGYAYEEKSVPGRPPASLFTSELVRGLETGEADIDGDQRVSVTDLYDYLRDRMRDLDARQTPQMDSRIQGRELIVANSLREPPPVPLPQKIRDMVESDMMPERMAVIEHLAKRLRKGGGDAPAAREALEQLRDDPDSSVRVIKAARETLASVAPGVPVAPGSSVGAGSAVGPGSPVAPRAPTTVSLPHDDAVMAVAFSADGRRLASACRDQTARLWDLESGREERRFEHDDWVLAAEPGPDGAQLATACRDGSARIWDVESGREHVRVAHDGIVWAVAFSPDGGLLATAGADATVRVWEVAGGRELDRIGYDAAVVAVRFSADARLLLTAEARGTTRVWALGGGGERGCLPGAEPTLAVSFADEHRALAARCAPDAVRVWDVLAGRDLARLGHEHARVVAFGGSGRYVATAGDDGTARVWDATGGGFEATRFGDCGRARAVAVTSEGRRLSVAGSDHVVRVWSGAW